MPHEADFILVGQAARILQRPDHQVRRTADRIWPDAPRSGRFRLIPRAKLCELAAAIADRYGDASRDESPKPKTTDAA